ncbi:MAG: response regulator transcription factor [Myxococcales bacterium]|nr:response regulator transcription factor [Myxococcales bacterium]
MANILVVQWHAEIRSLMVLLLRQRGYDVATAADLNAAAAAGRRFDLVCLDLMTPGLDEREPRRSFEQSPLGNRLDRAPLLLTDVNGRLEDLPREIRQQADGVFRPRTGHTFPFLVEVERLAPPPPQLPRPILTWRLDKRELPAFLYACFLFGVNGVITLRDKRVYKQLHLIDGWIRSAASSEESDWLGKMLLARHQISAEALNEVERALGTTKRRIGEEFVARGHLNEPQLAEALRQQYTSIAMSVFEWSALEVSLEEGEPNPQPQLTVHPFRLLINGLNYGFSAAEIDEQLGSLDVFPVPTIWTAFRFAEADPQPEELLLLQAINGQHSLRQIIQASPFSPEATKKFILALAIMHAVLLSPEARELPVGFEQQLQGNNEALIEEMFFREPPPKISFDDLGEDDADADRPPTWRTHLSFLDIRQGARFLLMILLGLVAVAVAWQWWAKKSAEEQAIREAKRPLIQHTEPVVIKKPTYQKADHLLAEAIQALNAGGWDGVGEARSLIGASLNIDPEFEAAINLRGSLDLAFDARFALQHNDLEAARGALEKAYRQAPGNPLLSELMTAAGMENPAVETPAP